MISSDIDDRFAIRNTSLPPSPVSYYLLLYYGRARPCVS